MEPQSLGLLAAAAFAAGAINAVAGGGSLVSFPALLAAGVPPVIASATNTVALTPGSLAAAYAYRRNLRGSGKTPALLVAAAAVGSATGATLLLALPARLFEIVVPWLVLIATLTLLGQKTVTRWAKTDAAPPRAARVAAVAAALALVAVYGGYFGAGMGIITLALLALLRHATIHQLNAQKSLIAGGINGIAALYFVAQHAIEPVVAVVMAAAALGGGYTGARVAQRVSAERVRRVVVGIGVVLSVALAIRYWAS